MIEFLPVILAILVGILFGSFFTILILTEKNKVIIDKHILENIVMYCEHQQIYDKLFKFGDFYYKLKKLL